MDSGNLEWKSEQAMSKEGKATNKEVWTQCRSSEKELVRRPEARRRTRTAWKPDRAAKQEELAVLALFF